MEKRYIWMHYKLLQKIWPFPSFFGLTKWWCRWGELCTIKYILLANTFYRYKHNSFYQWRAKFIYFFEIRRQHKSEWREKKSRFKNHWMPLVETNMFNILWIVDLKRLILGIQQFASRVIYWNISWWISWFWSRWWSVRKHSWHRKGRLERVNSRGMHKRSC